MAKVQMATGTGAMRRKGWRRPYLAERQRSLMIPVSGCGTSGGEVRGRGSQQGAGLRTLQTASEIMASMMAVPMRELFSPTAWLK